MASLSMASLNLSFSPLRPSPMVSTQASVQFARFNPSSLASTHFISGLRAVSPQKISTVVSQNTQKLQTLTVFAHKGYKMKTHKASAKRFRVTGRGKIVRRRSGKQHLLAKKNNKRKLRLSKMLLLNVRARGVNLQEKIGDWIRQDLKTHIFHVPDLAAIVFIHEVSRSDYDNVIGALPYLKVNRKAT
ncbi:hypothetical protein Bca101_009883 [Brassica carinata]